MANARLTEQILMAAFVRLIAQNVTAEICPVQPFVSAISTLSHKYRIRLEANYSSSSSIVQSGVDISSISLLSSMNTSSHTK